MEVLKHPLLVPSLEEVIEVLRDSLNSGFKEVSIEITECPNLEEAPFHLASKGICGKPKLVDVGGPPYLFPLADKTKIYNIENIAKLIELPNGFFIGAGAGPGHKIGVNCEMMPNIKVGKDANNQTRIIKLLDDGTYQLEAITDNSEFRFLANFFASGGLPGKVIKITAKTRLTDDNFISLLRKALYAKYKSQPVGMGGVFIIKKGEAKLHIMPDCSKTPIHTDEEANNWLKFYQMKAPLICLATFLSHDPGLDARVEHTHCFSTHGQGGHYHYDTTPDTVEYEAYLNLADEYCRIDKPKRANFISD